MTIQGQGLRAINRNKYENIHQRLRKKFVKSGMCSRCGKVGKRTEIALKKGHSYSEEINDYIELCVSCHRKMDYTEKSRESLIARTAGKPSPKRKLVIATGKGGRKENFCSLTEASKTKKISRTAISNTLTGRAKTAGGYKWSYGN